MNVKVSKTFIVSFLLIAVLAAGLSACFPFTQPQIESPASTSAIHTAAAATIVAEATLSAGKTAIAQLTQIAQGGLPATATPLPPTAIAQQPTATNTPFVPTATNTFVPPTITPIPPTVTPIYIPPAPATPIIPWYPPVQPPPQQVCDWVQFVTDVTTPDGSDFLPGQTFSKVWRLRNIGACTWSRQYDLVFVTGDRMQAPTVVPLPRNVAPGETIDIGVDLVAPNRAGDYRGYWMLSNQYGQEFGIGPAADKAFWVDIDVRSNPTGNNPLDFIANMCNASWRSNTRNLPCPGNSNSENGSVSLLNTPDIETGRHENEPALWTRPEASRGGQIAGWYPTFRVESGDRFLSDVGCLEGSRSCDVTFFLDYELPNGQVRNLGSWHEVYDRQITRIDVNLTDLAGQSVRFILRVQNNGGANSEANAFWLVPQIRRSGGVVPVPPPQQDIVTAARNALANGLGIDPSRVTVISAETAYWADACLGLPRSGESCAPVETYGYRIIMSARDRLYEVRTDQTGNVIRWQRL